MDERTQSHIISSYSLLFFPSFPISAEGKNLEYGLKQEGLLSFVRELNGNEEEPYDNYLRDASMYARGKNDSECDRQRSWLYSCIDVSDATND